MEWITQFIEFIKVISWPLVLLIIAIMFKPQLSDLIVRLNKAKLPGGFEFELAALKSSLANKALREQVDTNLAIQFYRNKRA